jgi:hypothetical protein
MFVHDELAVNRPDATASSRETPEAGGRFQFGAWPARWRWAVEVVILAAVLAATVLALRGPSAEQSFSVDESRWISTSRYFWITFVEHDLFGPAWQPNYIVYTHPPVARYLIGFGLWLQGWSPDQLNGRYDSLEGRLYNERMGNVPSPDLLAAARRVTFVFAVASVALIYIVARQLGGRVAGIAATVLALVNPLLTTVWTRALAESIVAAFGLLALALAVTAMPHVATLGKRAWLPLTLGATLALSAATKLNGGLGAIGLAAFAVVQQGLAVAETRRTRGLRAWIDAAMMAIVLFVAVNPLLYATPVERAVSLIRHRHDEMEFQRSVFTKDAVPDELSARIGRVAWRAFEDYATPPGPLPVSPDVVLVSVGIGVLAWRSIVDSRRRFAGPALLMLCWVVATYLVVTPNLGFDSSHYFAPLVALNVIVGGVAVAVMLRGVWRAVQAVSDRRSRAGQNVQAPVR